MPSKVRVEGEFPRINRLGIISASLCTLGLGLLLTSNILRVRENTQLEKEIRRTPVVMEDRNADEIPKRVERRFVEPQNLLLVISSASISENVLYGTPINGDTLYLNSEQHAQYMFR